MVGETQDSALESADRSTPRLADSQVKLIEQVCAANPRTVVVVNAAHAVDMPWAKRAAAVMCTWFPGQEFGPALAAVLSLSVFVIAASLTRLQLALHAGFRPPGSGGGSGSDTAGAGAGSGVHGVSNTLAFYIMTVLECDLAIVCASAPLA